MVDQERNFRSHYYDKVGFRAVDEKKSIESLLKEQPMKQEKLVHFCIRFGLPAMYRFYVWKILLGVLPVNQTCQDFVWFHRQEQVKELERAAILVCPDTIDGPQEMKLLVMKLIEEGRLPLQRKHLASDANNRYFMAMVRSLSGLDISETDLFWISTRFYRHVTTSLGSLENFPSYTMQCLMKEDKNQKLYQHLDKHQVISALPMGDWFHQCFASVLPETSVERIWDRVICGCSHVLVFVAVAIFLVLRRPLLAMQSAKEIVNYLNQIPEDCGDRIVSEALNLFQENNRVWPGKEDSPVVCGGSDSGRSSAKSFTDSVKLSTASGVGNASRSRHTSGTPTWDKAKGEGSGAGQVATAAGLSRRSPCLIGKAS